MRPGKRRVLPRTALGELWEKVEQARASIRAKVEHPFYVLKHRFRYRALAKNTAQLFSLFGFTNLMLGATVAAGCWMPTDKLRLKTENNGTDENGTGAAKTGSFSAC